jgi:hypothetical protein
MKRMDKECITMVGGNNNNNNNNNAMMYSLEEQER